MKEKVSSKTGGFYWLLLQPFILAHLPAEPAFVRFHSVHQVSEHTRNGRDPDSGAHQQHDLIVLYKRRIRENPYSLPGVMPIGIYVKKETINVIYHWVQFNTNKPNTSKLCLMAGNMTLMKDFIVNIHVIYTVSARAKVLSYTARKRFCGSAHPSVGLVQHRVHRGESLGHFALAATSDSMLHNGKKPGSYSLAQRNLNTARGIIRCRATTFTRWFCNALQCIGLLVP